MTGKYSHGGIARHSVLSVESLEDRSIPSVTSLTAFAVHLPKVTPLITPPGQAVIASELRVVPLAALVIEQDLAPLVRSVADSIPLDPIRTLVAPVLETVAPILSRVVVPTLEPIVPVLEPIAPILEPVVAPVPELIVPILPPVVTPPIVPAPIPSPVVEVVTKTVAELSPLLAPELPPIQAAPETPPITEVMEPIAPQPPAVAPPVESIAPPMPILWQDSVGVPSTTAAAPANERGVSTPPQSSVFVAERGDTPASVPENVSQHFPHQAADTTDILNGTPLESPTLFMMQGTEQDVQPELPAFVGGMVLEGAIPSAEAVSPDDGTGQDDEGQQREAANAGSAEMLESAPLPEMGGLEAFLAGLDRLGLPGGAGLRDWLLAAALAAMACELARRQMRTGRSRAASAEEAAEALSWSLTMGVCS